MLDALRSPYVGQRGVVTRITGNGEDYPLVRSPVGSDLGLRPAPDLGEHTNETLAEAFGEVPSVKRWS